MTLEQIEYIERELCNTMNSLEDVLKQEKQGVNRRYAELNATLLDDIYSSVTDAWLHIGRIKRRMSFDRTNDHS